MLRDGGTGGEGGAGSCWVDCLPVVPKLQCNRCPTAVQTCICPCQLLVRMGSIKLTKPVRHQRSKRGFANGRTVEGEVGPGCCGTSTCEGMRLQADVQGSLDGGGWREAQRGCLGTAGASRAWHAQHVQHFTETARVTVSLHQALARVRSNAGCRGVKGVKGGAINRLGHQIRR